VERLHEVEEAEELGADADAVGGHEVEVGGRVGTDHTERRPQRRIATVERRADGGGDRVAVVGHREPGDRVDPVLTAVGVADGAQALQFSPGEVGVGDVEPLVDHHGVGTRPAR
jgi:hypothetical protein